MVVLTVGVSVAVSKTPQLTPFTKAAIDLGVTAASSTIPVNGGAAATVAGFAGVGTAVGTISGAETGGTVRMAVAGAATVGAAAAGVALCGVGAYNLYQEGYSRRSLYLLVLGASEQPTTSTYTFDCWKQVVHDMTPELSSGRLLREIMMDPRVKQVIKVADNSPYPEIILENIWDEKFRIEYVLLPSNELAAHALLLSE